VLPLAKGHARLISPVIILFANVHLPKAEGIRHPYPMHKEVLRPPSPQGSAAAQPGIWMITKFDIFVTEALNQAKNEHTEQIDVTRGLGGLQTYLIALSIVSKALC